MAKYYLVEVKTRHPCTKADLSRRIVLIIANLTGRDGCFWLRRAQIPRLRFNNPLAEFIIPPSTADYFKRKAYYSAALRFFCKTELTDEEKLLFFQTALLILVF